MSCRLIFKAGVKIDSGKTARELPAVAGSGSKPKSDR